MKMLKLYTKNGYEIIKDLYYDQYIMVKKLI